MNFGLGHATSGSRGLADIGIECYTSVLPFSLSARPMPGGAPSPAGLVLVTETLGYSQTTRASEIFSENVLGIGNHLNMSRKSIPDGFTVGTIP